MKRLTIIILVILLAISCSDERTDNLSVTRTYEASFEEKAEGTKVYLEDNSFYWRKDDRISIFEGKTSNCQFKFDGATGDVSGTFSNVSGTPSGSDLPNIYSFYPYNNSTTISESGVITATLPSTQSYLSGSIADGMNPMVAVTSGISDRTLVFKNVCGYLLIKVKGSSTVRRIVLTGNSGEILSGTATITASYGDAPSVSMSEPEGVSITLDCGEAGVALNPTTYTAFYFVVPPTVFAAGFNITISDTEGGIMEKTTTAAKAIERNTILPMETFDYVPSPGWITPDPVGRWMELPVVTMNANRAYVSHYCSDDASVRNYSMLYDKNYRLALWVAYPLCTYYIGDASETNAWRYDPKIPNEFQPNLSSSYPVANEDRGHQLPSADRTRSEDQNKPTFYYSNMTPQNASLNQGIWANLENRVISYMPDCDTLYVITGPVLTTDTDPTVTYTTDKDGKEIALPKAYFKVLLKYKIEENEYSAIGFWLENRSYSYSFPVESDAHSVAWIESKTGYTFFDNLPEDIKVTVKNTFEPSRWNI